MVSELRCAPQAERLEMIGPSERYLALLDQTTRRNALVPKQSAVLYVTRSGLLRLGKGGHVGESYLVVVLQALGVEILDPGTATLTEQLASYAGARTLVFAEGSAMHGRQLLGRLPQDIVVLQRREEQKLARHNLTPRCRALRYVEASAVFAAPIGAEGRRLNAEGISLMTSMYCSPASLTWASIWQAGGRTATIWPRGIGIS